MMNPTIKVHFAPVEAGLSVKVDTALLVNICTRLYSFPGLTKTYQADDGRQHDAALTEQEAAALQIRRVHRML